MAAVRLMRSVDEVLGDREALEAFKTWAILDSSRCSSAIDLYYAVKQFKKTVEERTKDAPVLAISVHKNYISKKTGMCTFLPDPIREAMSKKAHGVKNTPPGVDFFDPIQPHLNEWMRKLHTQFICSEAFFELTRGQASVDEQKPSTSAEMTPKTNKKDRSASVATAPGFTTKPFTTGTLSSTFMPSTSSYTKSSPPAFNPFRTFKIDSVKVERVEQCMPQRHDNEEGRERFANSVAERLQRQIEQMRDKGVEFPRDLRSDKENFDDDLTDEAVERDVDDYAGRLDKIGATRRSASRSPPSLPITSPPSAPPAHLYGTNGFAPPPTNRLRRKLNENSIPSAGVSQASPTAVTSTKKGRCSMYHDSASSGFYSGLPSSASSAFSSHFSSAMGTQHFNTLRRPSHDANAFDRPPTFPTLGRPAYESYISTFAMAASVASHNHNLLNVGPHTATTSAALPNGFATLPRPMTSRPSSRPSSTSSAQQNDGKILLKLVVAGSRPMVFRTELEDGGMTLKKFRTIFGISREKNKFFFKNECEDDSSDYQWDLVDDDFAPVPIYHGSITAECRQILDSPE